MLLKFIDYLRYEKRYSERTLDIYSKAIEQFLDYSSVAPNDIQGLENLTPQQIRAWMVSLLENKEIPRTVNLKLSAVSRFFRFLRKEQLLTKNPVQDVRRPKMSKHLPEFFAASALNELLDSRPDTDDYPELRDYTMIELLYTTGIRRAELIALRPCDIYFPEHIIRVTGKGDKQREVPVPVAFLERLQHYLRVRSTTFPGLTAADSLFVTVKGKTLYPKAVNIAVFCRLDNRKGFTGTKSPHVLRHSLATHLLNNGADIMSIKETLGHASLAATQVYTHNSFEKLKNIYGKAHPRA
jgi:integrase/recombinase XerC